MTCPNCQHICREPEVCGTCPCGWFYVAVGRDAGWYDSQSEFELGALPMTGEDKGGPWII